jgi:SAM-dependent methyltransferase
MPPEQDPLAISQTRWRGDEPDETLTWGVRMGGDPFVDFMLAHVAPQPDDHIVEIGPGYGRITEAFLKRQIPFSSYVGLDISEARVSKLSRKFTDPRMSFIYADILRDVPLAKPAQLVFGSAVFEHFYPDFGPALAVISRFLASDGTLVFDLVRDGQTLRFKHNYFTDDAYVRIYGMDEIVEILEQGGFFLTAFAANSFGFGGETMGKDIGRIAICTRRIT